MFFECPFDLLLFAPHHIPVIIVGLFPLSFDKGFEYTVFEGGFELDVGTE